MSHLYPYSSWFSLASSPPYYPSPYYSPPSSLLPLLCLSPSFLPSSFSFLSRWVFKTMFSKGLVYRGYKVMPYSTACGTPISNFEAGRSVQEEYEGERERKREWKEGEREEECWSLKGGGKRNREMNEWIEFVCELSVSELLVIQFSVSELLEIQWVNLFTSHKIGRRRKRGRRSSWLDYLRALRLLIVDDLID